MQRDAATKSGPDIIFITALLMIAGKQDPAHVARSCNAAGALFTPRLTCVARVPRVMWPVLRASAEALTLKRMPDFDTSGHPSLVVPISVKNTERQDGTFLCFGKPCGQVWDVTVTESQLQAGVCPRVSVLIMGHDCG